MARQPRLDLPGIAQHVVQRGNDRQPCFFSPSDYQRYRQDLREIAMAEGCAIRAYVLMTNHVRLLMNPRQAGSIACVVQSLGRRYVRNVNDRYHRTGTLWEGRCKSCPVNGDAYLLRCYRYIELNPLRAAMVPDPADYPWSSFAANGQCQNDPLVRHPPVYRALAVTTEQRCDAYRALIREALNDEDIVGIRAHLQRQHAYGSGRFRAAIEAQLGRRAGPGKIGRPSKPRSFEESAL